MRHALVIARRELADKRFVALAAAAFAVLPFLLATIPGLRGRNGAADVIATAAGMLAIGFTGGLALVLGGNVIGDPGARALVESPYLANLGRVPLGWAGRQALAGAVREGPELLGAVAASFQLADSDRQVENLPPQRYNFPSSCCSSNSSCSSRR